MLPPEIPALPAVLPDPDWMPAVVPTLRPLLTALVTGARPLAVLQIRPAGLALDFFDRDELGTPQPVRPQQRWTWQKSDQALPALDLPAGATLALVEPDPRWRLPSRLEHAARTWYHPDIVLPAQALLPAQPLVSPGARADEPAGGPGNPSAVAAAVRRLAPLACGYDLILGDPAGHGILGDPAGHGMLGDPAGHGMLGDSAGHGVAGLVAVPLFPAGAVAGDSAAPANDRAGSAGDWAGSAGDRADPARASTVTAEVDVWLPPGIDEPVALPVVARQGGAPDQWPVVRIFAADLPPGRHGRVRLTLDGCGQVRLDGLPGVVDDQRRWTDLLDRVRAASAVEPADLVLAVEVCDGARADQRIEFARELVAGLAAACWLPGRLRVALIGYRQHQWDRYRTTGDHPVWTEMVGPPGEPAGFGLPAAAATALERWRGEPNRDDLAAAVEEALDCAVRLPWRPGARRVVLFIGSRPPYPPRQERDHALPCPRRRDWRAGVDALLARPWQTRLLAVWHPPIWWERTRSDSPTVVRTQQAWGELGADGFFVFGEISTAELIREAALAPTGGRPPLAVPAAAVCAVPAAAVCAGEAAVVSAGTVAGAPGGPGPGALFPRVADAVNRRRIP